jgi:hypothetical protein
LARSGEDPEVISGYDFSMAYLSRLARCVLFLSIALMLLTSVPGSGHPGSGHLAAPGRGAVAPASGSLVALAAASLRAGSGPGAGDHNWTRLCGAPCAEEFASMAFDAADGYVVYLDGIGMGADLPPFNTPPTWLFHAGNWTPLNVSAPTYREFASMSYDPQLREVILFGGCVRGHTCAGSGLLADTWAFSAGRWTQLAPGASPPARYGASMTYDATDRMLIVFGGKSASGAQLNDTWAFANGTWSAVAAGRAPPPGLVYPSLSDDPAVGGAILFGGLNGSAGTNATWKFNASGWGPLSPKHLPGASYGGSLVYNHRDGVLYLLVGGSDSTWKFVGGDWIAAAKVSTAVKFQYAGLVDDGADSALVLFGGFVGGCNARAACGDTWEYSNHTWREILDFPADREGAALAYDATDGYVVLFGGLGVRGYLGDTWRFVANNWTAISPRPSPSPRSFASMTWDAADGYVLLFGGDNTTSTLNDTWSFLHGAWSRIHPANAPSTRGGAVLDYDTSTSSVVLFQQGPSAGGYGNRTWNYHAGKWSLLSKAGGPTVDLIDLAYDPSVSGLVGLGNTTNHTGLQTWVFSAGVWNRSSTSTEPSRLGEVYFDYVHHWLLLYNSQRGTWEYSSGKWWLLHPRIAPEARYSFGFTYDAADHYVLLFGGYVISVDRLSLLGDTWSY